MLVNKLFRQRQK